MAHKPESIDISDRPDVLQLVEELKAPGTPWILKCREVEVALLTPLPTKPRRVPRKPTPEDDEAFFFAAGSWKDLVDTEQLKRDIYDARGSNRPPVEL